MITLLRSSGTQRESKETAMWIVWGFPLW